MIRCVVGCTCGLLSKECIRYKELLNYNLPATKLVADLRIKVEINLC